MSEQRAWLTFNEAVARLPAGERIHVFTRTGIGADWDREAVMEMLRKAVVEESGRVAQGMGHGLAAWDKPNHYWLVETA